MPIRTGTRLGDCEILSVVGSGGMGEVYRARDERLQREVAIKVLPDALAGDKDLLRRFEQEARAAAALNHPNILSVYQFGLTETGTPYVVMELLQGQTLRERLITGALPVRKTVEYALQITRGLAAAHDRGIIHRDLKPENLFITRDGVVKILDFGLAKLISTNGGAQNTITALGSEAGTVLGTMGYMAPEQLRGQTVDPRCDIFSLGAVLYEMLSGQRAFHGETPADTVSAILKEEPPDLSEHPGKIPPALARIVQRCLEKNPAERFQSARDLAFNLELLSSSSSSSGKVPAVEPPGKKKKTAPLLAAVLLLLVGLAVGFLLARGQKSLLPSREPVALRRLTDFVGMEESPALSPDGRSVAFTADFTGRRQTWVRLLSGGTPLQITKDDADHQSPRWSADSASLIYFTPSSDANGQGTIWEVPALGGTPHPIATSFSAGDLSHDGKLLAYLRASAGSVELAVADRDGGHPRSIARLDSDYNYGNVRWSPDDRLLAIQRGRTFDYDVLYVPSSGGELKPLTRDGNPLSGFAWLPDSSGVVYASSRGSTVLYLPTMNLWSVHLDGKDLRQLTFGEFSYESPDVDSKGNVVATRSRIQFDIWKYPVQGSARQNVARGVQITHQTGAVLTPTLSPHDGEVAYLSDSGGRGNIWVLNLEDGQSRQVTFEQDPRVAIGLPVWSPDGKYISFVRRGLTGWNVDLWLENPDGTNAHKVADNGGWACWSPDSRWLYYSPPTQKGFRIEKISPDGGNPIVVREDALKAAVGPDGTLYFTLNLASLNGVQGMEIRAARPENADARSVARIPGARLSLSLMQPVISPDGKWLALLLLDGPTTNIWIQPTDGGPMRQVTDFGREATFISRRVSWSADGKSIFAAVGKGEADIVWLSKLLQ
jgi:eukaryotic-like serine/threonine-protein kinase